MVHSIMQVSSAEMQKLDQSARSRLPCLYKIVLKLQDHTDISSRTAQTCFLWVPAAKASGWGNSQSYC